MRLLDRLRVLPHGSEVDHVAVILSHVLGPDGLDRLDPLAKELPARAEVGAVVRHLFAVPSPADAEDEPTVGNQIHARHLFGGVDRIALNEQADCRPDADRLAGESRHRERDEGVQRVPVVLRQLSATRPRRQPAGRDVRMLGDPQRLEAHLLHRRRELGHRDRVVGGKDRNAELHLFMVKDSIAAPRKPGLASALPRSCRPGRRAP